MTTEVQRTPTGLAVGRLARSSRQTRLNDGLGLALLVFLALAPLPLGGNRPFFWAAAPLVLGVFGAAYGVLLRQAGQGFRVSAWRFPETAVLFAILIGYLGVQILQVGIVGGQFVHAAPNGLALLSTTISLAPGSTTLMLLQLCGYGLLFFLVLQISVNDGRAYRFLRGIYWIIVANAVIGLVSLTQLADTILGIEKWAYLGSATGTFVNRNSYATFLAFGLVLGLAIIIDVVRQIASGERALRSSILSLGLTLAGSVLVLSALLASQSRMGLFAGGIGAVLVITLGLVRIRLSKRTRLASAVAAILAVAGLAYLYGGGVFERLGSLEQSIDVRGDLYRQVWGMILANPFFGYGGGAFELAYPLFHQPPVSADIVWNKAHSTYLALWSELGLIAGSLPLLIVAALAIRFALAYRRETTRYSLTLAALGVIAVAAIHSLVDFSLEIQANALVFTAILAVASARSAASARPQGPA